MLSSAVRWGYCSCSARIRPMTDSGKAASCGAASSTKQETSSRTSATFLNDETETVREISLWTMAFPYSAMARLRGRKELGPLTSELPPNLVEGVLAADHTPLAICRRITELLEGTRQRGRIDSYQLGIIDRNTQLLMDYIGGCERIHATPMPYAYAVHLRRALLVLFPDAAVRLGPEVRLERLRSPCC